MERNGAELFLGDRKKQAGTARDLEESECHAPGVITETCFVPALVSIWSHTWAHKFPIFPKHILRGFCHSCNQNAISGITCSSKFQEMRASRNNVGVAQCLNPRTLLTNMLFKIPYLWPLWKQTSLLSLLLAHLHRVPHYQLVLFASFLLCATSTQSWSVGFCFCLLLLSALGWPEDLKPPSQPSSALGTCWWGIPVHWWLSPCLRHSKSLLSIC